MEVLNRARRYPPPVTAAVYYPETGQFRFMGFEPTSAPEAGESDKLGSEISIGMLIDAAQPATNRFTIDNGWAMPILAHELSAV
ncbi:MAG TPA: hypothetical protein VG317_22795 [Pseudonocardiaceae bacterium]|nr:hypothetical protein [Pseudonocardiaceae bacterium]